MRIFICEQDPYRAKLIHDILGVYNYKIITVNDQNELFRQAYSRKPAVIVMSEMFPKKSAAEMLNKLRNDPVTSKIPVIFIGSRSLMEEQVFHQHMFDNLTEFLPEPIKIKNLRHYIDRWTTLRSLYIKH